MKVMAQNRSLRMRRGFTLMELSLVIALLSTLLVSMFVFYYNIGSIAEETSPASRKRARAYLAMEEMRGSLERTFWLPDQKRLIFHGRSGGDRTFARDRITFASVHPGAALSGRAGIREVSYYLEREEGDRYSLYRREDDLVDEEPGQGGAHYLLLEDVLSLQIRYTVTGIDWLKDFDSETGNTVPRLVRISLRYRAGNREELIETVAHPGIFL